MVLTCYLPFNILSVEIGLTFFGILDQALDELRLANVYKNLR